MRKLRPKTTELAARVAAASPSGKGRVPRTHRVRTMRAVTKAELLLTSSPFFPAPPGVGGLVGGQGCPQLMHSGPAGHCPPGTHSPFPVSYVLRSIRGTLSRVEQGVDVSLAEETPPGISRRAPHWRHPGCLELPPCLRTAHWGSGADILRPSRLTGPSVRRS